MSLSSAMWAGVSGMGAHSKKLNTISNNIANVNTIGYKSQRMDFSDLMYNSSYGTGGLMQTGYGVQASTVITSFAQGAYESTTNATDLAINGAGFFAVSNPANSETFYTRAGNFTFTKDGELVDSNNFILQGWKIPKENGVQQSTGGGNNAGTSAIVGTGTPTDVVLDAWTVQPFATSEINITANLSQDAGDKSDSSTSPFTALFDTWDGTAEPPLSDNAYAYQTSMKVYDEAGLEHTLTIYYDKVSEDAYTGGVDGGSMWEYIVTMEPTEDKREFLSDPNGTQLTKMKDTEMAGMLGAGTISFNSAGQATNQSAYTFLGGGTDNLTPFLDKDGLMKQVPLVTDPTDKNNWKPAAVSKNGYPIITPNFSGITDGQTAGTQTGLDNSIELDFGIQAKDFESPWTNDGSLADLEVEHPYTANPNSTGPEFFRNNLVYDSSKKSDVNNAIKSAESSWEKVMKELGLDNDTQSFDKLYWDAVSPTGPYAELEKAVNDALGARETAANQAKTNAEKAQTDAEKAQTDAQDSINDYDTAYAKTYTYVTGADYNDDYKNAYIASIKAATTDTTLQGNLDAATDDTTLTAAIDAILKAPGTASTAREVADEAGKVAAAVAAGGNTKANLETALETANKNLADAQTALKKADAELSEITKDRGTANKELATIKKLDDLSKAYIRDDLNLGDIEKMMEGYTFTTADGTLTAQDILNAIKKDVTNGNTATFDALMGDITEYTDPNGTTVTKGGGTPPAPDPFETGLNDVLIKNIKTTALDQAVAYEFDGGSGVIPNAATDSKNKVMQFFRQEADPALTTDWTVFTAGEAANANNLAVANDPKVIKEDAMQSQAGSSSTYSQKQNGYGFGNLSSYHVDSRGVLSGVYDNGVTMELYQIAMYDFNSPQNLRREGGNLYSETTESGLTAPNAAGVAGMGTISSNAIEQSNVDLATEFVLMITTQRGYQGNSKVVTTVDTMLDTVIQMKR